MREYVCPTLCRYYKPHRPDPEGCGAMQWLERRPGLGPALARLAPDHGSHLYGLTGGHPLLADICAACGYAAEDCDYRDPAVPDADCAPCGGLRAVAALLAAGEPLDGS
jgi:hypothetical protein